MRKVIKLAAQEDAKENERIRKIARKNLELTINLGPTFIKLGQVFSTRADMFPELYIEIFSELQDLVPPASFEEIKAEIKTDFHKDVNQVFPEFDPTPLQSASLGQVHKAVLNGKKVAVKVRRPNIQDRVRLDIAALKSMRFWFKYVMGNEFLMSMDLVLDHFEKTIYDEMNYVQEANNLKAIKKILAYDNSIIVPEVYDEYVTERVLTMEYIPGIKITDVKAIKNAGLDPADLGFRIVKMFTLMVLENPIFHADPHPGNIAVKPDGSIILYDYGMIGRLSKDARASLFNLYIALINKDAGKIIEALIEIGALEPSADKYVIKRGIDLALKSFEGKSVYEYEIREFLKVANRTFFEFPFRLPSNLTTFVRMYVLMEGVVLTLEPGFNMLKALGKIIEKSELKHEFLWYSINKEILRIVKFVSEFLDFPKNVNKYIDHVMYLERKKRSINIQLSILSGSLLISSSIIYFTNHLYGYIGFAAAIITFLFAIRRS